jgi:hypothetical protein
MAGSTIFEISLAEAAAHPVVGSFSMNSGNRCYPWRRSNRSKKGAPTDALASIPGRCDEAMDETASGVGRHAWR